MSAPVSPTRRLAVAVGIAATSATIAIGVTAASLLGWFSPTSRASIPELASETSVPAPPPAASPVILVPVAPTVAAPSVTVDADPVQLAMHAGDRGPVADDDDHDEDAEHDEHDERDEDSDDD